MSDDDAEGFTLDLADWDGLVPGSWIEEEDERGIEREAADCDLIAAELSEAVETDESGDDQPVADADPDLGTLNEHQREHWAAEPGPHTAEGRRRLSLVIEWEQAHMSSRISAAATSWEDVPLQGIVDAVAAGTLSLPVPTIGMLADGSAGLFYTGRVNGVAGESGAGKGWMLLAIGAAHMASGAHLYLLDFEDSPALAVLRLVTLGVDPDLIRSRFHYLHPAQHDEDGIERLVVRVGDTPGALVVIDSTGESMAAAGLNQNADDEVARWMQSLAHPLADRGEACVVLLDHMVKSEDGGLWPIGSQRKRAAITGAQYVVEVAKPFSRTEDGMVALKVAKDRHGAREARSVASYVQLVHPATTTVTPTAVSIIPGDTLAVIFGPGRDASQLAADRAARTSRALDADVAAIEGMSPPPTSYRDVKTRLGWRDGRAQAAMREWRSRRSAGSKP